MEGTETTFLCVHLTFFLLKKIKFVALGYVFNICHLLIFITTYEIKDSTLHFTDDKLRHRKGKSLASSHTV